MTAVISAKDKEGQGQDWGLSEIQRKRRDEATLHGKEAKGLHVLICFLIRSFTN